MKDDLADKSHLRKNLENMGIIRRDIKKERLIGCCGGQLHWPLHICMLKRALKDKFEREYLSLQSKLQDKN